ncbi:MAG: T9SS type A sorting domain-containing protein, partial [Bacteroidota bacterium]|nr:T9SS type A sorting domain-containing protein [Bacteroidota bacterium]
FKYSPAMLGTVASESDLVLARNDFGIWTPFVGTSGTLTDTIAKTMTANSLYDMAAFAGTDNNNPLPVVMNSFTVSLEGKNIAKLNWSTSQEINSDYFAIERSFDGSNFREIGSVKAKGNSQKLVQYQFKDAESVRKALEEGGANAIYYRLRQVDRDAKYSYSEIRVIDLNNLGEELAITPNPFKQSFGIAIAQTEATEMFVRIVDLSGKEVYSQIFALSPGSNEVDVDKLDKLMPGVYLANIKIGNQEKHIKIVKSE